MKATVLVNAYRQKTGRIELMEVTWKEYVDLYDKGWLKFQQPPQTERPEHLPDRATAAVWAGIGPPVPEELPAQEEPEIVEEIPEEGTEEEVEELSLSDKKPRSKSSHKLAAMQEVSVQLRRHKLQLTATELIEATAEKLDVPVTTVKIFYDRDLPKEAKPALLYGVGGKRVTRSQIKFRILLETREVMRKENPSYKPYKKELITRAYKLLGMTFDSASVYVYERLNEEQTKALDLGVAPNQTGLTLEEQIAVLKRVRREMTQRSLLAPRQVDLAKAAATALKMTVDSVRTLIVSLSEADKLELDFLQNRTRMLAGQKIETIRAGFLGAIAVLRLRKLPITKVNLRQVLKVKLTMIDLVLADHPDINALVDTESP
jgi:hypothetical protein